MKMICFEKCTTKIYIYDMEIINILVNDILI